MPTLPAILAPYVNSQGMGVATSSTGLSPAAPVEPVPVSPLRASIPNAEGLIHPLLMRAMIVSQIGEECPFPTIKAMADRYGVHPEQLRMYVRGLRDHLEPKLCKALGVEPVVFYRPAKAS